MEDKKIILIIDDDPDIVRSVKAILESEGYEVATAMSGKEGLEILSREKPDLILCDMMMERLNTGIRVAQDIRRQNNTVPIVLMSSIGETTALNTDIRELGFNGVLQKPVRPETLLSTVSGLLNT
jgi:CheY-like chemotaxis protein